MNKFIFFSHEDEFVSELSEAQKQRCKSIINHYGFSEHVQVFETCHGHIAILSKTMPVHGESENWAGRMTSDDLKFLASFPSRWIEFKKGGMAIGLIKE